MIMLRVRNRQSLLLFVAILILNGCNSRLQEQDFFITSLTILDACQAKEKDLNKSFTTTAIVPMSTIVDSLIISIDRSHKPYMYTVSNIQSDSLLGTFCRRGRSNNEVLDCLPIMDTFKNSDGDLCTTVFSFGDGRLFIWNITQSLASENDVYEKIVQLRNKENWFPFFSGYYQNDTSVVVRNSKQVGAIAAICEVPRYEVYNTDNGELIDRYNIFKQVQFETKNPVYSVQSFYGCVDCVKPDRTKIAIGMGYMPVYGILDLYSGEFNGFKIKDYLPFSPYERIWHFCSMAADDHLIYALYYGGDITPYTSRGTSTLIVFNWDGQIKSKYELNKYITQIGLSDNMLYLSHTDQTVYILDTREL